MKKRDENEFGESPVVEISCYECDGKGWQPFMDNGCPNQETCDVCKGQKTVFVSQEMADGLRDQTCKFSCEETIG